VTAAAATPFLSAGKMRTVERRLGQSCAVMARLVDRHGPCLLAGRSFLPVQSLVTSIIGQQLSVRAAATIRERVAAQVPGWEPVALAQLSPAQLRACGLSATKSRCLRELAHQVAEGRLRLEDLLQKPDEAVVEMLTRLPGIGPWTAQMFLIFGLGRMDVLAVGDGGLQRSARLLFGDDVRLEQVARPWRPYRSVASWYLWRHLEAPA